MSILLRIQRARKTAFYRLVHVSPSVSTFLPHLTRPSTSRGAHGLCTPDRSSPQHYRPKRRICGRAVEAGNTPGRSALKKRALVASNRNDHHRALEPLQFVIAGSKDSMDFFVLQSVKFCGHGHLVVGRWARKKSEKLNLSSCTNCQD